MEAVLQMNATYEGALAALRKAGATLVDVDAGHVEAYKEEHVPGEHLFLAAQSPWQVRGLQNKAACSDLCGHAEQRWRMLVGIAESVLGSGTSDPEPAVDQSKTTFGCAQPSMDIWI